MPGVCSRVSLLGQVANDRLHTQHVVGLQVVVRQVQALQAGQPVLRHLAQQGQVVGRQAQVAQAGQGLQAGQAGGGSEWGGGGMFGVCE